MTSGPSCLTLFCVCACKAARYFIYGRWLSPLLNYGQLLFLLSCWNLLQGKFEHQWNHAQRCSACACATSQGIQYMGDGHPHYLPMDRLYSCWVARIYYDAIFSIRNITLNAVLRVRVQHRKISHIQAMVIPVIGPWTASIPAGLANFVMQKFSTLAHSMFCLERLPHWSVPSGTFYMRVFVKIIMNSMHQKCRWCFSPSKTLFSSVHLLWMRAIKKKII